MRLLVLIAVLAGASLGSPVEEKARRVESGLLRAVTIKDRPVQKSTIAERLKEYKVPGVSVVVLSGGAVEWARGYGLASVEDKRPVTPETMFQAASISKPVAAMVAMRLVEMGKLSLDEDVNLKLRSWKVEENEFTSKEKVTLRRLLSHTAGLTVHGFPGYASTAPVPTLVQLLSGAKPANTALVRPDILPGSRYRYSGGGFEVMQLLVEEVTGKPFPVVARELVLGPLGMKHSTYEQPLPERYRKTAASAYRGDGAVIPGQWHTYPEMAAAGLWTTPSDLARVVFEMQKPGKVLKPETADLMLTVIQSNYGLGFGTGGRNGVRSFGHGGANEGYRCQLWAYRDLGSGAVIMTNGDRGDALTAEILRAISAEYGWVDHKPQEKSVAALSPEMLASYAGKYQFPGFAITVSVREGGLYADAGPRGSAAFLPQSETEFFDPDGQAPALRFTKAADGVIELRTSGVTARRQ